MNLKGKINFTKMEGAGNDYIYINCLHSVPSDLSRLSRDISDRHFGVGSDGLVAILPSENADFRMRMFNSDGSEAQMCGNASRCVGKYLYDHRLTEKREIALETLAGIKILKLHIIDGEVKSVTVDMGVPMTKPSMIPVISNNPEIMVSEEVIVEGNKFNITAVSMGNPHAVIFVDELDDRLVKHYGRLLENNPIFPEKSNIEFVVVKNPEELEMRVWERGSGETLACGTGACAACVAGVLNGLTRENVNIKLPGGCLNIFWDNETKHIFLTGPAEFVCEGVYFIK